MVDLRCAVYSEDGSGLAPDVIFIVSRKMLRSLASRAGVAPLHMVPVEIPEHLRKLTGDQIVAKTGKPRRLAAELWRFLATHVLESHKNVIVFHRDGDTTWEKRSTSENLSRIERGDFSEALRRGIEAVFSRRVHPAGAPAPRGRGLSLEDARACGERMLYCVPFYAIEAWLFAGCRDLPEVVPESGKSLAREWASHPETLDGVEAPKDQVSFGASLNRVLAERLDPDRLLSLESSFSRTVENWAKVGCIAAHLRRPVESPE